MTDSTTPQDDAAMSPALTGSVAKDLADSLRDISDSLNVCGNDFSDILYPAARELERLDKLRLTDAERELLHKMRVHLYEISRDNAFIDDVCDDAKASYVALSEFLERHG